MTNLYYAFIYPYLIYCNYIQGITYKTTLSKLQILQNKAIRIITGSPPRTNRYHGVIIWNEIFTAAINPDSSEVSFKTMVTKGVLQEVLTHAY